MPEKYSKNIAHKLTHYNTLIINKNILLTKPESCVTYSVVLDGRERIL